MARQPPPVEDHISGDSVSLLFDLVAAVTGPDIKSIGSTTHERRKDSNEVRANIVVCIRIFKK